MLLANNLSIWSWAGKSANESEFVIVIMNNKRDDPLKPSDIDWAVVFEPNLTLLTNHSCFQSTAYKIQFN
jgi:hypothetical protein